MRGINTDGYVIRAEQGLQCNQYLAGEALLDLGALAEETDNAVDLR